MCAPPLTAQRLVRTNCGLRLLGSAAMRRCWLAWAATLVARTAFTEPIDGLSFNDSSDAALAVCACAPASPLLLLLLSLLAALLCVRSVGGRCVACTGRVLACWARSRAQFTRTASPCGHGKLKRHGCQRPSRWSTHLTWFSTCGTLPVIEWTPRRCVTHAPPPRSLSWPAPPQHVLSQFLRWVWSLRIPTARFSSSHRQLHTVDICCSLCNARHRAGMLQNCSRCCQRGRVLQHIAHL